LDAWPHTLADTKKAELGRKQVAQNKVFLPPSTCAGVWNSHAIEKLSYWSLFWVSARRGIP